MGKKDKKEKKSKKEKKEKKEHKKKKHQHSDSSDSEDVIQTHQNLAAIDEDEWVERPIAGDGVDVNSGPVAQRDDWMNASLTKTDAPERDWMMAPESNPFRVMEKNTDNDPRVIEAKRKEAIRKERELNPFFAQGGSGLPTEESDAQIGEPPKKKIQFGDGGSTWRMIKLKKVFEISEREDRPLEEVALERYGTLEEFDEARREREFLDNRKGSGREGGGRDRDASWRHPASSSERFHSSAEFKKPETRDPDMDEFGRRRRNDDSKAPLTHAEKNFDKRSSHLPSSLPSQPSKIPPTIPQAYVPKASIPSTVEDADARPPIDVVAARDEMNRIQAKLLKASIMGMDEDPKLKERYESLERDVERAGAAAGERKSENDVVVVPTIDSRGRLQDVGEGGPSRLLPGNRRKRKQADTGDADEDTNISQLLLREKMSSSDNYDQQFANQIAKDITYKEGLDYMDERADNFAKKPSASNTHQRQRAITDYKKAQAAQENCSFCWQDSQPPKTHVLASGTKTYLGLPNFIDMVPYHCLIVPIQHALTTLECEDDVWDEIRNFMKCLIQMNWELGNGVIFIEQVINLKWHRHTFIECIPIPQDKFDLAPAYFKEAINSSEEEWSQHRKLIDTSKTGFRRSLTKELPFFHVWFDPNKGYGHVIEEGHSWEEWFGRQVIASMMDLSPDKWRRPKRANSADNVRRAQVFMKAFSKFDWTKMLE
ncbi:hypothetical protein HDU67_002614 [Dinochytrium kinnereticum]|nr:hypothetical protein HDU67_002614 [Dinochytrium kinnereticum]